MYALVSGWIQGIFNAGLAAAILWIYLGIFLGERKDRIWRCVFWIPFLSWHFIWIWMILRSVPLYFPFNSVINICCVTTVALGAYRGRIRVKFGYALAYVGIDALSEVLVWFLLSMVYSAEQIEQLWWASILSRGIMILVIVVLGHFFKKKYRGVDECYNGYLLFVSLGSLFVVHWIFRAYVHQLGGSGLAGSLICAVVMLCVNMLVYRIHYDTCRMLELKREKEAYEYRVEQYGRYQKEQEENFLEIRAIRHDLRKNLLYLRELAEHDCVEELKQRLRDLLETVDRERESVIRTGSLAVDAMMNDKYQDAKRSGVRFETDIQIPRDLPFENADLCIILGNLLDNAMEAVKRAGRSDGLVKAMMYYHRGNLVICIENHYDGVAKCGETQCLHVVKEDGLHHGLGLEIVERTVQKYRGTMEVTEDGTWFRVQVVLYSLSPSCSCKDTLL